jgi:hypothetical protein
MFDTAAIRVSAAGRDCVAEICGDQPAAVRCASQREHEDAPARPSTTAAWRGRHSTPSTSRRPRATMHLQTATIPWIHVRRAQIFWSATHTGVKLAGSVRPQGVPSTPFDGSRSLLHLLPASSRLACQHAGLRRRTMANKIAAAAAPSLRQRRRGPGSDQAARSCRQYWQARFLGRRIRRGPA